MTWHLGGGGGVRSGGTLGLRWCKAGTKWGVDLSLIRGGGEEEESRLTREKIPSGMLKHSLVRTAL